MNNTTPWSWSGAARACCGLPCSNGGDGAGDHAPLDGSNACIDPSLPSSRASPPVGSNVRVV
jgi:hypothetical protein